MPTMHARFFTRKQTQLPNEQRAISITGGASEDRGKKVSELLAVYKNWKAQVDVSGNDIVLRLGRNSIVNVNVKHFSVDVTLSSSVSGMKR